MAIVDASKLVQAGVPNFNLKIPEHIYKKIMFWVNKSDDEVGWFGDLVYDTKTKTYCVTDVYLLKQEVNTSTTEINEDHLAELMFEVYKKHGAKPPEGFHALKWWCHSHGKGATFWSGQDEKQIRKLGYRGWILATVFNQKREFRTAFCTKVNVMGNEHEIFIDDIKTSVLEVVDESIQKSWDEEFKSYVKAKTYQHTTSATDHVSNYFDRSPKSIAKTDGREPVLTKLEAVEEGYPRGGVGSPGFCLRGSSPTSVSRYVDAYGASLYPDNRSKINRARYGNKDWVNGFLSVPGYWIFGHYAGEEIIATAAFDSVGSPKQPIKLVVDMYMTEIVKLKADEDLIFVQETVQPDLKFLTGHADEAEIYNMMEENEITYGEATAYLLQKEDPYANT